ncbi:MAG: hypothetical protein FWC16_07815 [Defluviitaleaceae bacterium]|nr:hypothetical protein [Defluviitaleaceae bacterium]MCL2274821.1 hypothetical protein [Defluviitaleaceae bacterium]
MSLPKFTELPDGFGLENTICQILASIAMEEVGLSHIINAEGEKLQYVLGTLENSAPPTPPTVEQVLEVNESVREMLQQIGFSQMFLSQKMSDALKAYEKYQEGGGRGGTVTPPTEDKYNHFRPVGHPPHVFEKVDENGNGKNPPEYVYNPDDQPGNGKDQNAVKDKDGNFWAEATPPGNIWRPIDENGNTKDADAVWGGANGKPGDGDDKKATQFGGNWWVDMGQNVWRRVMNKNTLGPLTGGGTSQDPSNTPGTPVYEDKNGKYYIKDGKDADGNDLYYGDPFGGNTLLDSTQNGLEGDDVIYYKDANGNMTTTKPPHPSQPAPSNIHVTLQPASINYEVSDIPFQFTATVTGDYLVNGTGNDGVTWSISPTPGATITQSGIFSATQAGIYTITVRAKDDPTKSAIALVTVTAQDIEDEILHGDLGEVIIIDDHEWIKIKHKMYGGAPYALLMLKDVIGPMAYDSKSTGTIQYKEAEISDKVNSWYQYFNSPTLKKLAVESTSGANGTPSWPMKGSGVYALIPVEEELQGFGADVRVVNKKTYWLANPTSEPNAGTNYTKVLKYDGTIGPKLNSDNTNYARPVVWVKLS